MAADSHSKTVMSDGERTKLAQSLDEDLDDFIGNLKKAKYKDGWKPETWEEEMQKHPFFRSKPFEDGEELPPLIQGLQDLKYDRSLHSDSELAATFKEDGNMCFKVKKYRHAVDNYTEGLRKRHTDIQLITQLLTNRAAAHFHLGNFRSSLRDCERAVSVTPHHVKAIVRGVQSCSRLARHDQAVAWCDRGLALQPDHAELVRLRHTAAAQQRVEERNRRQAVLKQKRQQATEDALLTALRERSVRLADSDGSPVSGAELRVELLTPQVPGLANGVQLSEDGHLSWPLMFLYPEHSQSDLVQSAPETDTLSGHLWTMFGPDSQPPDWDRPQRRYTPERLDVYFETADGQRLVAVPADTQISTVLAHHRYVVKGGVPALIVLRRDSDFRAAFLGRYTVDELR